MSLQRSPFHHCSYSQGFAAPSRRLNFLVQETPYSAYVTIRKKFSRGFQDSSCQKIKALESRNHSLQNECAALVDEIGSTRSNNLLLQNRLTKAEQDMIKHYEDTKLCKSKLLDEIATLKSLQNKNSDIISKQKLEISKEEKKTKALEKNVKCLEIKNDNLNGQIANLKKSKGELQKEKNKLVKELKVLNKNQTGNLEIENDSNQNTLPLPILDPSCSLPSSIPEASSSALVTPPRGPPSLPPWSPTVIRAVTSTPPSPYTPPGVPPSTSQGLDNQTQTTSAFTLNLSESNLKSSIRQSPATHAKFSRNYLFLTPKPDTQCPKVCNHSPQCLIREPLPPPFPSITFLYNEKSEYHKAMMQWSQKEFAGCAKCFSIENENYGCRDCRWLKFWYSRHGETHGFPDIATWIYKKYL